MKLKVFILLLSSAFLLTLHIALAGSLKDFENSTSSSHSSSSGCDNTGLDSEYHRYNDDYSYESKEYYRERAKLREAEKSGEDGRAPAVSVDLWPDYEEIKDLRNEGYNGIPTIKIYGGFQKLVDDVKGYNFNIQGGRGVLGLELDYIRYFEDNPNDTLSFVTPRALARFPLGSYFEIDTGLGATVMTGQRVNTGFNYGASVYFYPWEHLVLESKLYGTTFSENKQMMDWDNALSLKYKMFGLRAGYRALITNGNRGLQGPEVGLFFQW